MEEHVLISVIIPVYNVENEVLIQCVSSVRNQTLAEIEILIVDDGSDTQTYSLCEKLGEQDKRIKVYHQNNKGVSAARNLGIEKAVGQWISFVDADDWIEENMLQRLLETSDRYDCDMVLCDAFIDYKKKEVVNRFFKDEFLESKESGIDRFLLQFICPGVYRDRDNVADCGAPWAKIYRTQFIKQNGLQYNLDLRRMQDNIFNLYAYELANNIVYIQEPLYHYRKSRNSGMYRMNSNIRTIYEKVFAEISDFNNRFQKSDDYWVGLSYKIFFSVYVILTNDFLHPDNRKNWLTKRREFFDMLETENYVWAMGKLKVAYLTKIERLFFCLMKRKLFFCLVVCIYSKQFLYRIMGRGV